MDLNEEWNVFISFASGRIFMPSVMICAGRWDVNAAPELMHDSEEDVWQVAITLPAGSVSEYKFAVLDSSGNLLALQQGNSGVRAVRMGDQRLEVQENW